MATYVGNFEELHCSNNTTVVLASTVTLLQTPSKLFTLGFQARRRVFFYRQEKNK